MEGEGCLLPHLLTPQGGRWLDLACLHLRAAQLAVQVPALSHHQAAAPRIAQSSRAAARWRQAQSIGCCMPCLRLAFDAGQVHVMCHLTEWHQAVMGRRQMLGQVNGTPAARP